ncbi:HAD-IIIC family phosphatase [Pseudobacter ginsenosidimutans]|uniref:HAD superfamily phosphatase (TIGR01681 family)/FkbH-like protein n=1 Tax=Pseudobacter ginsenosidimutans TaxID=661488 RepID=A0A4Q7MRQ0_9BACT|nr:HAD-IIIC family phosphatase [Pseudobacter ginsenosidimutans]QEC41898.1 HAD-IIIC family phosphatase [Pseudobacter ginsenosidimutans]RZS71277.1 HAD superfamily phosphatase (TIGR01681 family)/FkbH-like protein [Pseudobacter ginsenosidimutans]
MAPDNRSFIALKKFLKKPLDGLKTIRVAIVADSASQFIHQALKGYGIAEGIHYDIFEADYNQIDLQVFDPGSELYESKPDYVIILRSSEKLLKKFYSLSGEEKSQFGANQTAYAKNLCQQINSQLKTRVIFNTFPELNDGVFGNFSTKTPSSFLYQLRRLNIGLMDLAQEFKNLFLVDLAALVAQKGYAQLTDAKMYISADMVFSIDILPDLAEQLHKVIQAIAGSFKKCLILDLDNTTWGGIIGDDGMEGIQIGDLGLGKAFTDLQLWAKELKKRGIIIAVCSKNTESIAKEPFISHPDMKLRLEDIAVFVANWETKVDNIRHIQGILNIGFDSMVFLDDNPFEREMVKQNIPDITVPDLPEDPAEYMPYLRTLNLFETASFTEEDEQRTKQYQEEANRNILQKSFANEDEFLASLGMECEVKPFDNFTIPRIAQLSQRSNQFNLRTVRYTEEDIRRIAQSPDHLTLSFSLKDIYGDYGLIAFVILEKKENNTLFVDSWIMSCRVLKRGMEVFTLQNILQQAQDAGFREITGEYIPTKKNELVKEHYSKLGFKSTSENNYALQVDQYPNDKKVYIKRK